MKRTEYTPEARCALIDRVADWVYDNTESWEPDNIGLGLAYLFWSIADANGEPFDSTLFKTDEGYSELVKLLKQNPNGLWEELVKEGFII